MKYILCFLLLSLCFSNCKRPNPLIVTLPPSEKKLAISSVVIPDNILAVSVSYSFSALINSTDSSGNSTFDSTLYNQFLADHALVTISYSGKTDTLFKLTPGVYASANILQIPNETYTLQVHDSATDLRIQAQSTMLEKVGFDSLYFTKERTITDTTVNVHFSIADDLQKQNYYMVSYYNIAASPVYNAIFQNSTKEKFVLVEVYSDNVVDSDGKIRINKPLFLPDQNDSMVVQLAHISKGYYEFLTAYKKTNQLIFQLLGEPVSLPTNIIIGYGYFSTFNPTFKFVDLSKL